MLTAHLGWNVMHLLAVLLQRDCSETDLLKLHLNTEMKINKQFELSEENFSPLMNIQAWLQLNLKIEFSVCFFPALGAWQTQASSDMSQRETYRLKKVGGKKKEKKNREQIQTKKDSQSHEREALQK